MDLEPLNLIDGFSIGRFGFGQQLLEEGAPDRRDRVGSVPPGLVGYGQYNGAATQHLLDLEFEDSEFRRVDLVVRRIDGQQRRGDFPQVR